MHEAEQSSCVGLLCMPTDPPAWHFTLLDRNLLLSSCESFQFNRMSTCKGGVSRGPPKHQNKVVWKPNAGVKKNETEVGSKQRPFPTITGVCPRCKQQIEWRRKYGKYKALVEAGKCNDCGKRAVRQAHHTICTACSKNRNVCAKCCRPAETIVGSNVDAEEEERKQLEEALKNMRERDRRTLLRTLHGGGGAVKKPRNKDEDDEDTDADEEDDSELEVGSDGDEDEDKDGEEEGRRLCIG